MIKKVYLLLAVCLFSLTMSGKETLLDIIKNRLDSYNAILPCEKVYIQCDRPFYKPGEDIWMAVWITNGITNKSSEISEILTVELIDPKGNIKKSIRVMADNGRATCDFALDSASMGGIYTIKSYTNWMQNFGNDNYFTKEIQVQNVALPTLRMKLNMERKAYGVGDTVFADLSLQTLENNPLSDFTFNYVVNIDGVEFLQSTNKTNQEGKAVISFVLPSILQTNDGLLNVSINYKGNTESISRSIPIVLNNIDLQFFPEGGNLITGTENNCAFKALNEYGNPADVEGSVFNSKHQLITQFKSYHQGMGAFHFTPIKGEKYYALIDRPEGVMQLFQLPQPEENGYLMEIPQPLQFLNPINKQIATIRIVAPEQSIVSIIGQVQGKIYYSSCVPVAKGENFVSVPLAGFPCGVAQFTLFTTNNVEMCERLVFVHKDRQLKLDISTDKTYYLTREKVKLQVHATDENGNPVSTQLALSVVDDKLLSMADDKSDNILTWLLLSSEVKGKIDEPSFYFNPKEEKADSAIDFLLLTQGWRRFTWEEITETSSANLVKSIKFNQEKRILCGTVYGKNSESISKTRLFIQETGQTANPDEKGYYEFKNLDLTTPLTLIAISPQNDTVKTIIRDYTSVKTTRDYYYEKMKGKMVLGSIIDKDTKAPLPGAAIVVKGTTIGTISDIDGRFAVNATNKDRLRISFIGYEPVEINADQNKYQTIELEIIKTEIKEAIITGHANNRIARTVAASKIKKTDKSLNVKTEQDNEMRMVERKPLNPSNEPVLVTPLIVDELFHTVEIQLNANTSENIEVVEETEMSVEEEEVFIIVEEPALFQGGDLNAARDWVQRNLIYPSVAAENGIQGKVYLQFGVDGQGLVCDPRILRGADPSLDQEALRVIMTMPRWTPAKQGGRNVKQQFVIPILFKLDGEGGYNPSEQYAWKQLSQYYRKREFYSPVYSTQEDEYVRSDFRKTIYWNPLLQTDSLGIGNVEFYTSDELTTFRAISEGISNNGLIGRNEQYFFTQKPISIDAKIPERVCFEDSISIPVILKNTTSSDITGKVSVEYPASMLLLNSIKQEVTIPANDVLSFYFDFAVPGKSEDGKITLKFESNSYNDVVSSSISVRPYGYPKKITATGSKLDNHFEVSLSHIIPNSLKAEFVLYPGMESSFSSAIESMLKEPHGCFEQASAVTYPNVLALNYLKETGKSNPQLEERALRYITDGYKLLTSYETPSGGFEWYGKSPGHEGLTAFGLMEFNDMKKISSVVDYNMLSRTESWLAGRRDYNGGFFTEKGKYGFSNYAALLNNAYIVYALSEIGYKDMKMEFIRSCKDNIGRDDAYCMALLANAAINLQDSLSAAKLIGKLEKQIEAGGFNGLKSETSITGSGGKSLKVETASLLALALLKQAHPNETLLLSCIRYILDNRSFGSFGSTQSTILALKAITEYNKNNPELFNAGNVSLSINGNSKGEYHYTGEETNPLTISNFENYLKEGVNLLDVKFNETLTSANFNINIEYNSLVGETNPYMPVKIETKYTKKSAAQGETLRLTTTLVNTEKRCQSMTMVIINLPSGFIFQPWQLKELKEKNIYDFYEIKNNQLFIYYRDLKPNAIHVINLDVKATIPGVYHSLPSCCYLYYTPEYKCYSKPEILKITK